MYRAPELLDTWANYPVDTKADIWACGCLLFVLCFHYHPFEDSAKLAILNGNYKIPPHDTTYTMFHDLLRQMLTVDPTLRPDSNQVLQHLTGISLSHGIDPTLVSSKFLSALLIMCLHKYHEKWRYLFYLFPELTSIILCYISGN